MIKLCLKIFILSVLLAGLGGCSKTIKHQVVESELPKENKLKTAVVQPKKSLTKEFIMDERAFLYYVNGTIYEELKDYYSASASYKQALQIYPTSYEIRYSFAKMLYQMQQFNDVIETLETIKPEDAPIYEIRAHCYRALGMSDLAKDSYYKTIELDSLNAMSFSYLASYFRREMKIDSVIWAYHKLVKIRPDNYRLWSELGKLYIENNNFQDAKTVLYESIALNQSEANLLSVLRLGELYEMTNMLDSAIVFYQLAYSINNNDILVNRMLSNYYIQVDSIALAIPYSKKIVELEPSDINAVKRLASIYFSADSLSLADSLFTFLLSVGDNNPGNYYYLGRIAVKQNELPRARDYFISLTQVADTSVESWLDLCFVYRKLNDTENEIKTFMTGINHMRNENDGVRLLFGLGSAYENAKQYDKAIGVFEEIIAKVPDHDQALNYLGYMLVDRGERLDYAKELIEKALSHKPENVAYLDSYGWLFYRLGDTKKALKYLKQAVALDNDPVIFDHLGDALNASGDYDAACEAWKKALDLAPDDEKIKEKLNR